MVAVLRDRSVLHLQGRLRE